MGQGWRRGYFGVLKPGQLRRPLASNPVGCFILRAVESSSMTWETIDVEREDGVAWLRLDNPDSLNVLTVETLEAIEEALRSLTDARALILTGTGKAFAAGADVEYMRDFSSPQAQAYAELGHRVTDGIEQFPAPVIAAINGYAFGGGLELALASDIRIASERALMGQTEIELGIIPGWGGTQRLPQIAGDELARRLIFFAERFDATDAYEYDIVRDVIAHDRLEPFAADMAEDLAEKPQYAIRTAKEALNRARRGDEGGFAFERRAWASLFGTADQREGMDAFVEDRDPEFGSADEN
jgi:enoyl-CoA hydratase/carnithine racemase